jgi:hypothetical protein
MALGRQNDETNRKRLRAGWIARRSVPSNLPFVWLPPLVLSASAYSASVHRPPNSRSATRDNLNVSTSVGNLSNSRSEAPKWTSIDTYMTGKYSFPCELAT